MLKLEKLIINRFKPDLLVVVGDVNSTLAAALTANKLGIKLAHVESGLRSKDLTMPEEINRIITDKISDMCFITEQDGLENLKKEGKNESSLFFLGNTMIDTLISFESKIQSSKILDELGLRPKDFALMTMHRPSNVDSAEGLNKMVYLIDELSKNIDLVFPIHPRTLNQLKRNNLYTKIEKNQRLKILPPLDYFAFQKLISKSKLVLTDSGGIQEETTFRKVPCLTLRHSTERPSTILLGTNKLVPFDIDLIKKEINEVEHGTYKEGQIPPKWDGSSTKRILQVIYDDLSDI